MSCFVSGDSVLIIREERRETIYAGLKKPKQKSKNIARELWSKKPIFKLINNIISSDSVALTPEQCFQHPKLPMRYSQANKEQRIPNPAKQGTQIKIQGTKKINWLFF